MPRRLQWWRTASPPLYCLCPSILHTLKDRLNKITLKSLWPRGTLLKNLMEFGTNQFLPRLSWQWGTSECAAWGQQHPPHMFSLFVSVCNCVSFVLDHIIREIFEFEMSSYLQPRQTFLFNHNQSRAVQHSVFEEYFKCCGSAYWIESGFGSR